jgi:hypothetical protein
MLKTVIEENAASMKNLVINILDEEKKEEVKIRKYELYLWSYSSSTSS